MSARGILRAMPLTLNDVARIMNNIAAQFSSNVELYEQCKLRFERVGLAVVLSVDVLNSRFETVELTVSQDERKTAWFVNGAPVEEAYLTYSNLVERFKHLHIGVYNTLNNLHGEVEKRGANWAIVYDRQQNGVIVTNKATGFFLFKVAFTPYNRLNEATTLMVCFDDMHSYEKFQSYGQLITALYSKKILIQKTKPVPTRQSVAYTQKNAKLTSLVYKHAILDVGTEQRPK